MEACPPAKYFNLRPEGLHSEINLVHYLVTIQITGDYSYNCDYLGIGDYSDF